MPPSRLRGTFDKDPVAHREVETNDAVGQRAGLISRRLFVACTLLGPLWLGSRAHAAQVSPQNLDQGLLKAVLDTLIPETDTPSASQLGVEREILDLSATVPNYPELLAYGETWINKAVGLFFHATPFDRLEEAHRVRLLRMMENAQAGSGEQVYFSRLRDDAMRLYYAHPRAWAVVGLHTPPQPDGYLDYADPPVSR